MPFAYWVSLLRQTISLWTAHKSQRLGAALAYYAIFSLAPLFIIFISIVGFVYGEQRAQAQLLEQLRQMVGSQGAELIGALIAGARRSNSDLLATLVGLGVLVFGALNVFSQLQDAINTLWEVKRPERHGLMRVARDKFVSLAMVLVIGFLLLLAFVASTLIARLGPYLGSLLPFPAGGLEALNLALSFGLSTLLFGLLYKFLPDCTVKWSEVWYGALLSALLFTLGKFVIAWYLGATRISTVYGSAGSLVALLIFIYYSAQIVLFGAALTHVYALRERGATAIQRSRTNA